MPPCSLSRPTMKPVVSCRKMIGMFLLVAVHDEARGLVGRVVVDDARHVHAGRWPRLAAGHLLLGELLLVGDDAAGESADAGVGADERAAVLAAVLVDGRCPRRRSNLTVSSCVVLLPPGSLGEDVVDGARGLRCRLRFEAPTRRWLRRPVRAEDLLTKSGCVRSRDRRSSRGSRSVPEISACMRAPPNSSLGQRSDRSRP
jgi:hypothetical protein